MKAEEQARRTEQRCYEMDGLLYVPHYTRDGVYVGPGQRERTLTALQVERAQPVMRGLWPRGYQK